MNIRRHLIGQRQKFPTVYSAINRQKPDIYLVGNFIYSNASGGALIKVPESAGSTVHYKRQVPFNCVCH